MAEEKPLTKSDLAEALDDALNKKRAINNETHFDDHEFIRLLKEREQRRERRVEKFKMSMIGSAAVGAVGFLVWVGGLVIDAFSHGQHPS